MQILLYLVEIVTLFPIEIQKGQISKHLTTTTTTTNPQLQTNWGRLYESLFHLNTFHSSRLLLHTKKPIDQLCLISKILGV